MAEFLTSDPWARHSGATVPDFNRLPRAIALTAAPYSPGGPDGNVAS